MFDDVCLGGDVLLLCYRLSRTKRFCAIFAVAYYLCGVVFSSSSSLQQSLILLMRVEFGLRDAGERESEKSGQRSTQRKSRAILFTKGILSENLSGHERFRWNRKNEHRNIRKSEGKKAALLEVIEL